MKHTLYIDHPDHFGAYNYLPGEKDCDTVVSRTVGYPAKFICNAFARASQGDVYQITFDSAEDATAFALKSPFPLVDAASVQKYVERKSRFISGFLLSRTAYPKFRSACPSLFAGIVLQV